MIATLSSLSLPPSSDTFDVDTYLLAYAAMSFLYEVCDSNLQLNGEITRAENISNEIKQIVQFREHLQI